MLLELLDLERMDVVLLRQDPPFDMGYITTTHILERLPKRVLVVNDPYWVRNSPEKVFVTEFPDLMPPTLITSEPQAIRAFRAEHGEIVVKPLYGNGGQGVFRIPPGGGQDELELVVPQDEFDMPNGLCFSPDESLLYINDTPRAHIKVFDVAADGSLSNGRMFFEGIGTGVIEEGIPDGMKCDERGNIWVTGPGGVWVISAEGEHIGTILVPENTGNMTWGGEDWHTLYIPSSTSLYAIKTIVGPRREPYMR